jgi:tyrosine-protein phosphatase SIW14
MVRIKKVVLANILAAAFAFFAPHPAWSQETFQAPGKVDGIQNWSHVTDTFYRGAQPSSAGYKTLQQMGVGIVVDFRDESREISTESKEVEALGVKFVSIPWSGSDKPSTIQVVQFLDLVRTNPGAKIFVHCKRGADRTGVMVAAYRIVVQHKDVSDAVAEMHEFHYDHFWLPQLERYVQSLPQLLSADPLFAAYAVPKASSSNTATPGVASATFRGTQVETSTRVQ